MNGDDNTTDDLVEQLSRLEAVDRRVTPEHVARRFRELQRAIMDDVRLDDPLDLREASTSTGYAAIVERFHSDIEEVLPASADADRVDDSRSIIVIRGSEEEIRHHIRALLQRISAIEHDAGASGIRVSASIGWASASAWGHDYDALAAAAGTASASARADGGDRWKRAEENGSASPATLEA